MSSHPETTEHHLQYLLISHRSFSTILSTLSAQPSLLTAVERLTVSGNDRLTVEPLNQEDWSGYAALIWTINFLFISNKKQELPQLDCGGGLAQVSNTEIPTPPDNAKGIS